MKKILNIRTNHPDDRVDTIILDDGTEHQSVKITSAIMSNGETFLQTGSERFQGPSLHIAPLSSLRVWYDTKEHTWHTKVVDVESG